jgi:hypothetical protein
MKLFPALLLPGLLAITALAGCSSMTPADFKTGRPEMRLEEYFNGDSTAYGLFFDRSQDLKPCMAFGTARPSL